MSAPKADPLVAILKSFQDENEPAEVAASTIRTLFHVQTHGERNAEMAAIQEWQTRMKKRLEAAEELAIIAMGDEP